MTTVIGRAGTLSGTILDPPPPAVDEIMLVKSYNDITNNYCPSMLSKDQNNVVLTDLVRILALNCFSVGGVAVAAAGSFVGDF